MRTRALSQSFRAGLELLAPIAEQVVSSLETQHWYLNEIASDGFLASLISISPFVPNPCSAPLHEARAKDRSPSLTKLT